MSTNAPTSTLKAFLQIIKLEGGQGALPVSAALAGVALVAYAISGAVLHGLEHTLVGAISYGGSTALLLAASTFAVLRSYKRSELTLQTLSALAATGAFMAVTSVLLHFVLAVALPPPLPTDRLVRFLLFPIVAWNVFMFAWLYRHTGMRAIPAFALAITYVVTINWIFGSLMH